MDLIQIMISDLLKVIHLLDRQTVYPQSTSDKTMQKPKIFDFCQARKQKFTNFARTQST